MRRLYYNTCTAVPYSLLYILLYIVYILLYIVYILLYISLHSYILHYTLYTFYYTFTIHYIYILLDEYLAELQEVLQGSVLQL